MRPRIFAATGDGAMADQRIVLIASIKMLSQTKNRSI